MAKISGGGRKPGKRGRTRSKLKKTSGKVTINKIMEEYDVNERVHIIIDPSYHDGLPDKSFHGLTGKIVKKRGNAFEVELKKGNKKFLVVTNSVHLKRVSEKK